MKPLKDSMTPAPDKLYTMFPCMQQCKWICRWLQNDIYYVFGGCLTCMRCQQSIALGTIKSTIFCQIDFLTYFSFCLLRFLHPFHLLDICKICSLKISSKNISLFFLYKGKNLILQNEWIYDWTKILQKEWDNSPKIHYTTIHIYNLMQFD